MDISDAYPASAHDHRIFKAEWQRLSQRLDRALPLLADKAYVGLDGLTEGQIQVPLKRGTRHLPAPTVENLSSKRVRVEHLFARLKCWRALTNAHYHHETVARIAQAILNWLLR